MACFLVSLLQVLLASGAVVLSLWVAVPPMGIVALGLAGVLITLMQVLPAEQYPRIRKWLLSVGWICALTVISSLLMSGKFIPDIYYGAPFWLLALAGLAGTLRLNAITARNDLRKLALAWGSVGTLLYVAGSYWENQKPGFYLGLLLLLAILILSKIWFRFSWVQVQVVNFFLLVLFGLPAVDLFFRSGYEADLRPEPERKLFSYNSAKHDPAAFGRWWRHYLDQWDLMGKDVFMPDPSGILPFRLKPGSEGRLFESHITINSQGFRGKEFSREKGDAYRIVVLGESTTFGCTLRADDVPWPEVLERIIREQLHAPRHIEVINAGVPAYTLVDSINRLTSDILPLKPDLLITYHGVNGFRMLDNALPSLSGKVPPIYRQRPLKLLSDCEYRIKVVYYRHLQTARLRVHEPSFTDLMDSKYAQAYKQVIEITHTNGIHLALCTFSMAINDRSESGLIEFYGSSFPAAPWFIKANAAHSQLLKNLTAQHTEVLLVNTHPMLDGEHEKFIDVAHLTQEGRQQLAENVFAAIRSTLETKFERPQDARQ